jgi:hypothetical protein
LQFQRLSQQIHGSYRLDSKIVLFPNGLQQKIGAGREKLIRGKMGGVGIRGFWPGTPMDCGWRLPVAF